MSFHERAAKADNEARKTKKERLLIKYVYIDLSHFKILTHTENDARAHPELLFIYLSRGPANEVDYDIEGDNKASFWDMQPAVYAVRTDRSHRCGME